MFEKRVLVMFPEEDIVICDRCSVTCIGIHPEPGKLNVKAVSFVADNNAMHWCMGQHQFERASLFKM